ncbi:MAG: hypothetical protein K6T86_07565 [Pirellulales bacterium]|nr:hypothetical protein [Pirellulales bacterium]
MRNAMRLWTVLLVMVALSVPAWSQTSTKLQQNGTPQAKKKQQPSQARGGLAEQQSDAAPQAAPQQGMPRRVGTDRATPASEAGGGKRQAAPPEDGLVPVDHQPLEGAEGLMARAAVLPQQSPIEGQPLQLLQLATRTASRAQQQQAIEAYWQLAAAVARYTFRWDDYAQLEQLLPPAVELDRHTRRGVDPALESQLSAAQARLREAEAAVLAAQYHLIEAAGLPPRPLPLPADIPHVGPYNTKFQTLFAARPAPAQVRMLDRVLPLRRRAIEVRAAAVQAALDAVDAAFESPDGSADLLVVLRTLDDLARQRQAFVDSVLAYNREIAAYALAVAPPQTSPQQLVGMLIKLPGQGRRPASVAHQPGDINRTNFEQPLDSAGPALTPPGEPTPADPSAQGIPAQGEPTPADPATRPPDDGQPEPADESSRLHRDGTPWLASLRAGRCYAAHPHSGPYHHVALRQQADEALYPGLRGVPPARRAQQLAEALHWLASHSQSSAKPLPLLVCLRQAAESGRARAMHDALAAYWSAQQHAARLAVLGQQAEQLASLRHEVTRLLTSGQVPAVAGDPVLSLWAAEQGARADVCDAEAEWAKAQLALAQQLFRAQGSEEYVPSTAPHAGSYRLKLEAQRDSVAQRSDVQRLAQEIPATHSTLVQQAAAVVAADAHRAAVSPEAIEEALAATRRLTTETLAFLQSVTEYNLRIGDYALAVLGEAAPPERLEAALVLPRADAASK